MQFNFFQQHMNIKNVLGVYFRPFLANLHIQSLINVFRE